MNASELADYLLNFIMMIEDYDESKHENAATMLRQQQAEIEALEKLVSEMKYEKSSGVYEMNNKPVNPYQSITDTKIEPTVVSYTHPVKELTYEDGIEECAQRAEAYAYMSPNFTALAKELRAILKRVQEK